MRHKTYGRPTTARIHNEMDEPINKPKNVLIVGMKDTIEVIAHIGNKLGSFVKTLCNLIIYFSFSFPYPIFYLLHLKT